MKFIYIALGVLSLPATVILSNLFWMGLRESRAIATLLGNLDLLRQVLTLDALNHASAEVARFTRPVAGGYSMNIQAFRQSDKEAHSRGRKILRIGLAVVIFGSGVTGFLGIGWLGLALPIVNVLILQITFLGSIRGSIDSATTGRAIEHVRILAIILKRWHSESPRDAIDWLEGEPQLKPLWEHLTTIHISTPIQA